MLLMKENHVANRIFNAKEIEKLRSDLVECQSIAQDIENAKKAGISGIEILEDRHKRCVEDLQKKMDVYGKMK
jgi:hypothetical protein